MHHGVFVPVPEDVSEQGGNQGVGQMLTLPGREYCVGDFLAMDARHGRHVRGAPGQQAGDSYLLQPFMLPGGEAQVMLFEVEADFAHHQPVYGLEQVDIVDGRQAQFKAAGFKPGGESDENAQLGIELFPDAGLEQLEYAFLAFALPGELKGGDNGDTTFRQWGLPDLNFVEAAGAVVSQQFLGDARGEPRRVGGGWQGFELLQLPPQIRVEPGVAGDDLSEFVQGRALRQQGDETPGGISVCAACQSQLLIDELNLPIRR